MTSQSKSLLASYRQFEPYGIGAGLTTLLGSNAIWRQGA